MCSWVYESVFGGEQAHRCVSTQLMLVTDHFLAASRISLPVSAALCQQYRCLWDTKACFNEIKIPCYWYFYSYLLIMFFYHALLFSFSIIVPRLLFTSWKSNIVFIYRIYADTSQIKCSSYRHMTFMDTFSLIF